MNNKRTVLPVCGNNGYFIKSNQRKEKMKENEVLLKSVFDARPEKNGGEALLIITEFFDNGDSGHEGIYINQKIELMSYGNSASICLFGPGAAFVPENLRDLANQIESGYNKALAVREQLDKELDKEQIDTALYQFTFLTSNNSLSDETLYITVKYYCNGDEGMGSIYTEQEIKLNSNCNAACLNLTGSILTATKLYELANQLERDYDKAIKLNKEKHSVTS